MRRLIWVAIIATLFTGCFLIKDQSEKEDCKELLNESEILLQQWIHVVDSLQAEIDSCQASKL